MHRSCVVLTAVLTFAMIVASRPPAARAQAGEEQLRRELDAVKEQLRRVEQQMKQQEELIRRLSGERPAPAPAAPPPATAAPRPAPPVAAPAVVPDVEELKRMILADIQPQLSAANKTFASQFNPAIGFIVDTVFSHSSQQKSNFEFRSAEIGISAAIDPYARAYGIINGTPDDVEVEEAAIVTTSLPWNLAVKGGRFFADFGRLSTFHDHDLPFVNRPLVLDQYVGGESQGDGVELNWLVPIPHYLSLTAGMYNKVGADNDRVDNNVPRDVSEFTYLARAATSFSLNDEHSIDVGVSDTYAPEVRIENKKGRNLSGIDFTYRYTPLASASYRGFVWGNELLLNHEYRETSPGNGDFKLQNSFGMYSYLEARWTRRLYTGFLFEYVQDVDNKNLSTKQYSPYLTLWASEFQRLRFQYTHSDTPGKSDDSFFLQWTAVIGSHVHSFRDR